VTFTRQQTEVCTIALSTRCNNKTLQDLCLSILAALTISFCLQIDVPHPDRKFDLNFDRENEENLVSIVCVSIFFFCVIALIGASVFLEKWQQQQHEKMRKY
jgi:hypothetical protein